MAERRPGLEVRGVVSETELMTLYSGAVALLYPSCYEGFGLPVLEAMQCGTPVIVSEDPALVETAGDAGFRYESAGGLSEAMASLMEDPELREELRRRSLQRAAEFSWDRTARATFEIYRSILAR